MLEKFFSPKQSYSIANSDNKINIWEGAVRSGKTYASIWRFIDECRNGPPGQFAIICRTYDTFKRNLLPDLYGILGSQVVYSPGKRECYIGTRACHVIGADDDRAEAKIRGPTFAGIYMDEITILPEVVFKMAISRASIAESKIFGTTNPDSPGHWLKKEFLDGENPDVTSFAFKMDDNPSLTDDYKEMLKRQYKGIWRKRYIDGLWTQAHGAIYDFFDLEEHTIRAFPHAKEYIVGVDYGTHNPCAFVMIGINRQGYPNYWVEKEYYWDSRVQQRQKSDADYAADLADFCDGFYVSSVYVDPSAASFRLELSRTGFTSLCHVDNDVLNGIRYVSTCISSGTLKISVGCEKLIEEIRSYIWDARAAKQGKDEPLKTGDHLCLSGDTVVLTDVGLEEISSLSSGKCWSYDPDTEEFSLENFHNAQATQEDADIYEILLEDGTSIEATESHPFYTPKGVKRLNELTLCDTLISCSINATMEKSST